MNCNVSLWHYWFPPYQENLKPSENRTLSPTSEVQGVPTNNTVNMLHTSIQTGNNFHIKLIYQKTIWISVFTEKIHVHCKSFTLEWHQEFLFPKHSHIHHLWRTMCFISTRHLHTIQLWTTSTMITKPIQSNHSKRLPSNYATTANPSNVIQTNAFKLRLHIHSITLKCTTVTQSNQKPTKHGNHGTPCKSYTQTQHAMNTRDQTQWYPTEQNLQ